MPISRIILATVIAMAMVLLVNYCFVPYAERTGMPTTLRVMAGVAAICVTVALVMLVFRKYIIARR